MNRLVLIIAALTTYSILFMACAAPQEATKITAPEPGSILKEEKRADWEIAWDKTIKLAQKEGKITVVTSAGAPLRLALSENFKKKFGVEIEITTGRGGELASRLLSQRRAGLYVLDIYLGGATTIHTQIKPAGALEPLELQFILPELKEPEMIKKNWWGGNFRWLDDEHLTMAITTYSSPSIGINTNLVKPGEIKGYADLLNPRWKGKIILNDPTQAGTGGKHFGVVGSRIMGWDYWEKMLKQEPVIVVDQRLMVEWLAQGKYAVLVGILPEIAQEFIIAGAPIAFVRPVEGSYLTSGHGTLNYIKNAPHPKASKIFLNWILTKEGMTIASQALATPSSRLDVTTKGLDPSLLLYPDKKYVVSDDEKFSLEQTEHFKRAKELFAPILK